MESRTIVASRLKTLGGLAFLAAVTGMCAFMAGASPLDGHIWMPRLGVALGGLGVLLYGWMLVRPMVLRLDGKGFELSGGLYLRPQKVAWRDVEGFVARASRYGSFTIEYTYLVGRTPPGRWARMIGFGGARGSLPSGWTITAPELAQLLTEYCWQAAHAHRPRTEAAATTTAP